VIVGWIPLAVIDFMQFSIYFAAFEPDSDDEYEDVEGDDDDDGGEYEDYDDDDAAFANAQPQCATQ
jgi:hypothetical protein